MKLVNFPPANAVTTKVFGKLCLCYDADNNSAHTYKDNIMTKSWELLDKAYILINTGHVPQAQFVINQIISHNPQNIEAWELYISTIETVSELQQLTHFVESIWDAGAQDNDFLDANRRYILRRINQRIQSL